LDRALIVMRPAHPGVVCGACDERAFAANSTIV
jgi:hypothetical protein